MNKLEKLDKKLKNLPSSPGVYLLKDAKGQVLYVGKSGNLKARVKSYFQNGTRFYNAAKVKMLQEIKDVQIIKAHSEIEALVKESELIKKIKPRFNVLMRDNKNYIYVGVTGEDFPRIITTHQPIQNKELRIKNQDKIKYIGPFTDAKAIRKTLRLLRKIFPYYTKKSHGSKLERQLGVVPQEDITKIEYKKNIQAIKKILTGKNKALERELKRQIKEASKDRDYEKAKKTKEQLEYLQEVIAHEHVLSSDIALVPSIFPDTAPNFRLLGLKKDPKRIEAYDISNIQGNEATGSMVVFERNLKGKYFPNKSEYKKFKIKTIKGANDPAMMKEIIERRLKNNWPLPDLVIVDGGRPQLNAALKALQESKIMNHELRIRIIALAKKLEEVYFPERQDPVLAEKLGPVTKYLLQAIRNETHRFAVQFHRQLHKKSILN